MFYMFTEDKEGLNMISEENTKADCIRKAREYYAEKADSAGDSFYEVEGYLHKLNDDGETVEMDNCYLFGTLAPRSSIFRGGAS